MSAPLPRFPSPNFGDRRDGLRPSLIVIHYTAMQSCAAARARLCEAEAEVSAHWLIAKTGQAEQLVDEALRAWHAGAGAWQGLEDINSRSIGIELDNPGDAPFPEPQMAALECLLTQIMARWGIGPEGVIGHSDMAPGRKIDPGPRFDWQRLARQGLALWPQAEVGQGPAVDLPPEMLQSRFTAALQRIGYPAAAEDILLSSFRLRFRPGCWGALDAEDLHIAEALARRFAVDRAARNA